MNKKADWIVVRSPKGNLVAMEDNKDGLFKKLMNKEVDIICTYANGTLTSAIEWAESLMEDN